MKLNLLLIILTSVFTTSANAEQMTYFVGPNKCSLDFTIASEGKPVVPAVVNNTSTFLFLDTGATTILDLAFAKEIGLNPIETEEVGTGITGIAGKRWITCVDIQIGKIRISSFPVSCLDLNALRELNKSKNLPDLV